MRNLKTMAPSLSACRRDRRWRAQDQFAMVGLVALLGVSLAIAVPGCKPSGQAASASPADQRGDAEQSRLSIDQGPGPEGELGLPAIEKAAASGKYLFALFWKEDDAATAAMKTVFEAAMAKTADRADSVVIQVTSRAEKRIIQRFQLNRAPMPLILALAPNGAITGGFPTKVEEKDLLAAFATPCTERCMKALQQNKLVFVCIQNKSTKSNEPAMQGLRDFQADPRYKEATEIVTLDPSDDREASLLNDLKINPKTENAMTAFMAPPGAVIAEFTGATTKQELVAALEKAASAACPGGKCGPGGCGPQP